MLCDRLAALKVPNAAQVAVDLMRGFPCATLKFPVLAHIERLARDLQKERVLTKDPSEEAVRRLSHLHGGDMRSVTKGLIRRTGMGVKDRRVGGCQRRNRGLTFRVRLSPR